MYLKELTINGFKSFAKKGELEFSAPITAIVGPNGSGKSNVAESFRFVLGEQSVKSMRGRRGEDLIWGGSEQVSRGNRASVELVFDNTNRTFTLDFDEVKIERIVHRDGQNEYKLNGSTVRLKDVHELLANANIGSTGHHIISQGEAARVLAAGPKERREMIEDALGLKVYQLKKQEAERKLQKTKDNIEQVESLRREAAPHLKYLKKQVEKAERSLQVQAELRQSYAEYLKREDTYVAFHFDRLHAEKRTPVARLEEVQEQLATTKATLADTPAPTESPAVTEAETACHEAAKERQAAERECGRLEGQKVFIEKRLSSMQAADSAPTVIDKRELEELVTTIEQGAEKALSKGGESVLERALSDFVHQLRTFLKRETGVPIASSKQDEAELQQVEKDLQAAEKVLAAAVTKETSAKEKLVAIQAAQSADTEKNREAERELFTLTNEARELEHTIDGIERELAMLERDRSDFKQQLQEAVSLLGRDATAYYTHEVRGADDQVLGEADIVAEPREEQRTRAHELEKLKIRLEELGVGATDELVKEYHDAKERDAFLEKELQDLGASVENLKQLTIDMESKLHDQFVTGLEKITKEFHTFFTLMFGGGSAALERIELKRTADEEDDNNLIFRIFIFLIKKVN